MQSYMRTEVLRLSKEHTDELRVLKIAWDLRSLDEVIERLIKPHRVEKLRALGVKQVKGEEQ